MNRSFAIQGVVPQVASSFVFVFLRESLLASIPASFTITSHHHHIHHCC